jgi:hypothetical protein
MEMRTVNIIRTAKPFQQYLTSLPETDFKVNIISLCQAEKSFIEAIRLEERSTFVIDINAVDVINSFLEIAHQNYPVSENVRIVVVSDLQTWSNTLPVAYANNITGGFRRRKPAAGALEKYSLENTLYDVARSGDVSLKLVYLGLVYGRKGFDFHEVFMYVTLFLRNSTTFFIFLLLNLSLSYPGIFGVTSFLCHLLRLRQVHLMRR